VTVTVTVRLFGWYISRLISAYYPSPRYYSIYRPDTVELISRTDSVTLGILPLRTHACVPIMYVRALLTTVSIWCAYMCILLYFLQFLLGRQLFFSFWPYDKCAPMIYPCMVFVGRDEDIFAHRSTAFILLRSRSK
jgi:hypothetical protein